MKTLIYHPRSLSVSILLWLATFGLACPAGAQSFWNAFSGSSTDTNWSTAANWSPSGAPGPGANVLFGTGTIVGSLAVPNSYVNQSFTITSLQYTNTTTGDNLTQVGPGNTLTVTNGMLAGVIGSFIGYDMLTGPGSLVLTNGGILQVDAAFGSAQPANSVTLDLSGLNNFTVTNVSKIWVGVRGATAPYNANNEEGILYLAKTNVIALTGTGPGATNALLVGWNGNAGLNCALYLGQTNIIFADSVGVGSFKTTACLMTFETGLNNPVAYFRGRAAAPTSRVLYWGVGDVTGTPSAGSGCSGTNDFTGGFVDALIDKMDVAVGTFGNNGASASGTFTFNAGTIDVNTLTNSWNQNSGNTSANNGTINVNGTGTLRVNTQLFMGLNSGGGPANATLNVTNGTVLVNKIVRGAGTGTVAINLGAATLVLTNTAGTPAAPINSFNMAGSSLTVSPMVIGTNVSVGTIAASGVNTINIGTVPLIFSYPAQFHLIGYASSLGDLTTFTLGTLPSGSPVYQGYISNNLTGNSIDLVLTNGPQASNPPPSPIAVTWNGVLSGNWDTNTANWTSGGQPAIYTNLTTSGSGDPVTFDDTLKGTTNVNLTMVLNPGSWTVNNSASNYLFSGSGSISGVTSLIKEGTASLTLAETGGDNFSGGILASNGTLILDDTNSLMAGGTVITSGAVLQLGNNDASGTFPAGLITNSGTIIFDRSDSALSVGTVISGSGAVTVSGSGTVTLSTAEAYTGNTTVNSGTLALAGPNQTTSGLALSSNLVINSGATVIVDSDNALAGTTATPALQITVNAGGTLTGLATANSGGGTSSHIHSPLTLNGGTLAMGGSQIPAQTHGSWDLEGGVNVPGGPVTAVMSALNMDPDGAGGGTAFNITNGTTPSGIDLDVSGTLNNPSAQASTGINKNGPGTMQLDGANTFIGGANLNGGVLLLNNSNAVQDSTVTVNANNSLQFTPGIGTFNLGGLAGADSLVLSSTNGGPVTIKVGADNFNTSYSGILAGNGGLIKVGTSTLYLQGTNTYTGNTVINAGDLGLSEPANVTNSPNLTLASGATLDVSGRIDSTLTLNSGHNFFGAGTLNGSLTNNPGSSTYVGGVGAIGTLAVSGDASLSGTVYLEVTNDGTVFDVLQASTIEFGGTLVVSNLDTANPFAAGQSFQLFSGSCSGAFAAIVPATPGPGLLWDTSTLDSSGTLNIITGTIPQPGISSVVLSGTNLVFSGTNGSFGGTYSVLTTTNLTLPLSLWTTNSSSSFDNSGNFSVTNGVSPNTPARFYLLKTP